MLSRRELPKFAKGLNLVIPDDQSDQGTQKANPTLFDRESTINLEVKSIKRKSKSPGVKSRFSQKGEFKSDLEMFNSNVF